MKAKMLVLLAVGALVALLLAAPALASGNLKFYASLSGPDEFGTERSTGHYLDPGSPTTAEGQAFLRLHKRAAELRFKVAVDGLADPTGVRLLLLTERGDGSVRVDAVATLWEGAERGEFSGWLTRGSLTSRDLRGPLADLSLDQLVPLIAAGRLHVVVQTAAHGRGEIGGPLKLSKHE